MLDVRKKNFELVMMKPLILINFKNYPEAVGKKALNLAKQVSKTKKGKYEIAIAPTFLTMKEIVKNTNLTVFSQHTDHTGLGAHTGNVSAQELKEIGVRGSILNHSEKKISLKKLAGTIKNCQQNKLKTIVCASTPSEIKKVAKLNPDYVAYEPKELIGGNVSVTEFKPKLIVKAVKIVKKISPGTKLLCGAGIHSGKDLRHALKLGAEGVLIGHAVPKAKNPKEFLEKMLR